MHSFKRFLKYWAPPLIWMGIIFCLSSRQSTSVSDQFVINFIFFKTLHVVEYGFLYLLFYRAFWAVHTKKSANPFLLAAVSTISYAILDEIHQLFVPTREGTLRDVGIDILGITLMYLLIKNNVEFVKKIL